MGGARSKRRECVIHEESIGDKLYRRILDADTGELVSASWVEHRKSPSGRKPRGRPPWFYKLYASNWQDIIDKKRLTLYERGLFVSLLRYVGWNSNFLVHPNTGKNLSESDLAEMLDADRKRLREGLLALNRQGFLAIVRRGEGRSNHFMLNSHVAFFGKVIKDASEHAAFDNVAYEPRVRVQYKEAAPDSQLDPIR